jgi:hypothetical protein
VALALQSVIFWFRFKHLNHETFNAGDELDEEDEQEQEQRAALKV